jgi:hypothetical protein
MELEFVQVNLYGTFDHFAAIQIHLKNSIFGMIGGGNKKIMTVRTVKFMGGIVIFSKKHVNH